MSELSVIITGLSGDSEDGLTLSVNSLVSLPTELFAVKRNLYSPVVCGVPFIVPLDALNVRP